VICCLIVLIHSVKLETADSSETLATAYETTRRHNHNIKMYILRNFNVNANKKRQFDIEATPYKSNFLNIPVLYLCYVQVPRTLTLIWLMIVTCCLSVWGNFFRSRNYKANLCDFVRPKDSLRPSSAGRLTKNWRQQ
jgi:uncharacterized membrane-anchored protein YitT (DUF2179 family)